MPFGIRPRGERHSLSDAMAKIMAELLFDSNVSSRFSAGEGVTSLWRTEGKSGRVEARACVYSHVVDEIHKNFEDLSGGTVRLVKQKEADLSLPVRVPDEEALKLFYRRKAPAYEVTFSIPITPTLTQKFADACRTFPEDYPGKGWMLEALEKGLAHGRG